MYHLELHWAIAIKVSECFAPHPIDPVQ